MDDFEKRGQIIGGGLKDIVIREKNNEKLELGELLVVENKFDDDDMEKDYIILQVKDTGYGSQEPQSTHELLAGMELEGHNPDLGYMNPELTNYAIGHVKPLIHVKKEKDEKFITKSPKKLPGFSDFIRSINENDLEFLEPEKHKDSVFLGKVRSGSEVTDMDVYIDAKDALSHHIFIPATTGRGKSNLVKVMLWGIIDTKKTGILVLDPHDEYYGRRSLGLKDHPNSEKRLDYYSTEPITGEGTLKINVKSIDPNHLYGIINFSTAQKEVIRQAHNLFKKDWIKKTMLETDYKKLGATKIDTLQVIQRRFRNVLGIDDSEDEIRFKGSVFTDAVDGLNTVNEIIESLKLGKIVVIDTSRLTDNEELLIGSIIIEKLFYTYKKYTFDELNKKPVISIVIEEAPRVLGSSALEGHESKNIYGTIAREGRKFKIGLIAITQLTSLIPKTVLANMNTKIILGNEMAVERNSVIESASQDLSDDNRIIASLDKGEAIVSSVFSRFAIPIYTPEFNKEFIEEYKRKLPKVRTLKGLETKYEG